MNDKNMVHTSDGKAENLAHVWRNQVFFEKKYFKSVLAVNKRNALNISNF